MHEFIRWEISFLNTNYALKDQVDSLKRKGSAVPHLLLCWWEMMEPAKLMLPLRSNLCRDWFQFNLIKFDADITEAVLLDAIKKLNEDRKFMEYSCSFLYQNIFRKKVVRLINPEKDVDGFNPVNTGQIVQGLPGFIPATPHGIQLLLQHYNIETTENMQW